jgi:hypothetical protein
VIVVRYDYGGRFGVGVPAWMGLAGARWRLVNTAPAGFTWSTSPPARTAQAARNVLIDPGYRVASVKFPVRDQAGQFTSSLPGRTDPSISSHQLKPAANRRS